MKIILVAIMALFLLCPVIADDMEPKYQPMDAQDIIQWYTLEVTKSIQEDAEQLYWISLFTVSENISCFDIDISTEPIDRWDPFWHPVWSIDGSNCVDKRTYNCEAE